MARFQVFLSVVTAGKENSVGVKNRFPTPVSRSLWQVCTASGQKPDPRDLQGWDSVTDRRIERLHPEVQGNARDFVNAVASELGIQLRVTQGTRSIAEQDALYAKGRTTPGPIVTYARGGESYHNYGLAIDVVEIQVGLPVWNTNWQAIGEIGIRNGFEWGGNWTTPDKPHFQRTFGLSVSDLQGGASP